MTGIGVGVMSMASNVPVSCSPRSFVAKLLSADPK